MNIKIVKNKYINAALLLMLFSAILHMAILFYFAIVSGDLYTLNYFNILDIDLLFANVTNNGIGNFLSVAVVLVIYGAILSINKTE